MPIQIPSSNSTLPPASLPQLTSIFPITQSHSLPTYILPSTNFAYLTTGSTSTANTNMFLIANPNQHTLQPIHILAPIDPATAQFATTAHNTISPIHVELSTNKSNTMMETNKQTKEQLPFKKRRYTGQSSPMDMSHFDDDEGSNDSMKKWTVDVSSLSLSSPWIDVSWKRNVFFSVVIRVMFHFFSCLDILVVRCICS